MNHMNSYIDVENRRFVAAALAALAAAAHHTITDHRSSVLIAVSSSLANF